MNLAVKRKIFLFLILIILIYNFNNSNAYQNDSQNIKNIDINQFINKNYDQETLDNIFDGKTNIKEDVYIEINEDYFKGELQSLGNNIPENKDIGSYLKPKHIIDKDLITKQIFSEKERDDSVLIENAFKILSEIPNYSKLFNNLKDKTNIIFGEDIEDYGKAMPEVSFLGIQLAPPKIIVSAKYKQTLWKNPVYLAITIAHELFHMEDYENALNPKQDGSKYATELNAYLGQVYVYEYLKLRYPKEFINQTNQDILVYIKLQEFYRDIILYKEGKKDKLDENNYKPLSVIGKFRIKDYIKIITENDQNSKGVFSFNGLVVLGYFTNGNVKDFTSALTNIVQSIKKNRKGFDIAINSARSIYINYSNFRGITCSSNSSGLYCGNINLDEMPEFLNQNNSNQNQQPINPPSQPSSDDWGVEPQPPSNGGEIGINPGEPPSPLPTNPNWDGRIQ